MRYRALFHTSASPLLEPGLTPSQKLGPSPSYSGSRASNLHNFMWVEGHFSVEWSPLGWTDRAWALRS